MSLCIVPGGNGVAQRAPLSVHRAERRRRTALSKPIQEQIFKSRLTITYRTDITGTVQQENLPYRLLVLGEFAGRSLRRGNLLPDLGTRGVRTIKRGTTVNDHLREVIPIWRIPEGDEALRPLRSAIPGQIHFDKVTCLIPLTALDKPGETAFSLSGSAHFRSAEGDNGMTEITGDVRVHGSLTVTIADRTATAKGAKIDLTGAVTGTYVDPATNKVVGILTGFLEMRGISLDDKRVTISPVEEGEEDGAAAAAGDRKVKAFAVTVEGAQSGHAERTIPFTSVDSFAPDAVATSIPEVYRLRVLKQLLLDLQSGLRNRPDLRKRLKDMLPGYGESTAAIEAKLAGFRELKAWAGESFPLLQIEPPDVAPPAGGGGAPAGGGGAPAGGGGAPAGGGGAPAGGGGADGT
ncbi:type VI secretion system contractile sheath small subunit [Sorangium sp. So ce590]|uniref:type VI secretion system contractile sheath small subunit n=1 Tax=Sorangium sp. So ce590 TaxID=3133317 RepID=UPI003F62AE66